MEFPWIIFNQFFFHSDRSHITDFLLLIIHQKNSIDKIFFGISQTLFKTNLEIVQSPGLLDSFASTIYCFHLLSYYDSCSGYDSASQYWAHSTYAQNRNVSMGSNDSNRMQNYHFYCYRHTVVAAAWPVADNFYHKFLLYYAMTTYIKFCYYH